MASNSFTQLPPVLLEDIHRRIADAPNGVASAMAFEATCKDLHTTCRTIRLRRVAVPHHRHGIHPFERWNAAHGQRVDSLHLSLGKLTRDCPPVRDYNLAATTLHVTVHLASSLAPIAALPRTATLTVERLSACACVDLAPLATLAPSLRSLSLTISPTATVPSLLPLAALSALTALELHNLAICRTLHILARLPPGLRRLHLTNGPHIPNLDPLAKCTSLTHLTLDSFPLLESLQPVAALVSLRHLRLVRVACTVNLQPLCFALPVLRSLELRSCAVATPEHIPTIGCGQLQTLRLLDCDCAPNLAPLSALTALHTLDLFSLRPPAHTLHFLSPLTHLRSLRLSCSRACSNLAPLQPLTALTHLELHGPTRATSLSPLAALTHLRSLHLAHCRHVDSLAPLTALTSLQQLHCKSLRHVTSLEPLTRLPSLHKVDITDCPLVNQQALHSLQHAFLRSCSCT